MANGRNRRRGLRGAFNLTAPGTVLTIGFIALAVGLGVLLSRGATPKYTLSDPGPPEEYEIVEDEGLPGQRNLQLRTIKFKSCASTVTVNLLLDMSLSMTRDTPTIGQTKLSRLREAVTALVSSANDESVFGIQSFKSTGFAPYTPIVKNDVPVSFYKDVKDLIPNVLSSYVADGATPTYDALAFSRNILSEAISNEKFKDRKFNLIFVSDGAPCPGVGCNKVPGPNKDPRLYDPNPADEIKALGVTVYSLGIYDGSETKDPQLAELLRSVATSPEHYYAASTGDEINLLLKNISTRICNETSTPS